MKIMITGAAGFIGTALTKYCSEAGCPVLGFDIREPSCEWTGKAFELWDVRNTTRLTELISRFRPERIFRLAPDRPLLQPRETVDVKVGGTINLYECLPAEDLSPVVVTACSSAEYGPVASVDLPVARPIRFVPSIPMVSARSARTCWLSNTFINYAISSIRIRIFNTTGSGKIGDVCSDLTLTADEATLSGGREPHQPPRAH